MRLAILGSTRGTHLLTFIEAIAAKKISATIELVMSNKADALILERAREHGLRAHFENTEQKISEKLHAYNIELIILVGYMKILSGDFIKEWENKIINVHPSLLPAFAGKMSQDVHRAVLESKVKETGCTVHFVTEEVDAGPILIQKKCLVLPDDTVDTLKSRVQQLEKEALVESVRGLQ